MSDSEKKKEDWMNNKWRPMMGWMYMVVCMADFVLFPVLWSLVQAIGGGQVHTQWNPITLQGAGLFHMAMGAILGIAAFGRTQEKIAGANNGGAGAALPSMTPTPSYTPPATISQTMAQPMSAPKSTYTPTYSAAPAPVVTSSGKPGPAPMAEPEL